MDVESENMVVGPQKNGKLKVRCSKKLISYEDEKGSRQLCMSLEWQIFSSLSPEL